MSYANTLHYLIIACMFTRSILAPDSVSRALHTKQNLWVYWVYPTPRNACCSMTKCSLAWQNLLENLTFIGRCSANIFAEYNQQDAAFHNLFISVRRSTCFREIFRPSSGVQNCTWQRQVFVRPVLLPAASLFRTAAGLEMFRNAYVMYWAITAIGVATLVYAVGTKR